MLRKWFAFPVVRAGAIAVLALALLMAFPTTRALAGELLDLFRVRQVVVLPIDSTGLENMTGSEAFGSQLGRLISSSIIVTDEPGAPVLVASAEEAGNAAGFNVRLPQEIIPSRISVTDSAAFTMRIDRAKAQAFLDGGGRSDLVLPDDIDGAEISISIPASVRAAFGDCPEPQTAESGVDMRNMEGLYPDCVVFSQLPSPIVNTPEDLDIDQLAQIGLKFTGMSAEEAEAFTSSVDWTTTLVVPIPKNSTTYADVSVDGVIGKFIQRDANDLPNYVLLWVKDGILYFVSGSGTDTFRAFEIANALP